ncbi:hypothetical protein TNCV_951711 [Trichonephila clavipes]|nr:hypothetical protein TNCV_951711 [Trichonephila clavipes]
MIGMSTVKVNTWNQTLMEVQEKEFILFHELLGGDALELQLLIHRYTKQCFSILGSYDNPTPLAHVDASRDALPREAPQVSVGVNFLPGQLNPPPAEKHRLLSPDLKKTRALRTHSLLINAERALVFVMDWSADFFNEY